MAKNEIFTGRRFNRDRLITMAYFCRSADGQGLPLLITGNPGTAKTATIAAVARRLRTPYLHLSPAQKGDAYFGVVPVPETDKDGVRYLSCPPVMPIRQMIAVGHGIICLDELRNCPRQLAAAMLGILQEREFGDVQLPPGVRVIALSNEYQDSANGTPLSAAAANRMAHIKWPDQEVHELLNYALSGKMGEDFYRQTTTFEEDAFDHDWVTNVEKKIFDLYPDEIKAAATQVARFLEACSSSKDKIGLNMKPEARSKEADGPWQSLRSWSNVIMTLASVRCAKRVGAIENVPEGEDIELATLLDGLVGPAGSTMLHWIKDQDLPDIVAVLDGKVQLSPDDSRADRWALITAQAANRIIDCDINGKHRDGLTVQQATERRRRWAKRFFEICVAVSDRQGYESVAFAVSRIVRDGAAMDVASEAAQRCITTNAGRLRHAKGVA